MDQSRVQIIQFPMEFFCSQVAQAAEHTGVKLSDNAEFYVVNLLQSLMLAEEFNRRLESRLQVGVQDWAVPANKHSEFLKLKSVGDCALFMSGYYPDRFNRVIVSAKQFAALGRWAYQRVGEDSSYRFIYQELADCFPQIIDLLHQVRVQNSYFGKHDWQMVAENNKRHFTL